MTSLKRALTTWGVHLLGLWVIEAWDSGWRPKDFHRQDDAYIGTLRERLEEAGGKCFDNRHSPYPFVLKRRGA